MTRKLHHGIVAIKNQMLEVKTILNTRTLIVDPAICVKSISLIYLGLCDSGYTLWNISILIGRKYFSKNTIQNNKILIMPPYVKFLLPHTLTKTKDQCSNRLHKNSLSPVKSTRREWKDRNGSTSICVIVVRTQMTLSNKVLLHKDGRVFCLFMCVRQVKGFVWGNNHQATV